MNRGLRPPPQDRSHSWSGSPGSALGQRAPSLTTALPRSAMSLADITADLRAPVQTKVDEKPMVKVHAREWAKVMAGEPVEINPSVGHGFKIMTVDEWSARWKPNEAFPECLQCGGKNTKEHHFTQARRTQGGGGGRWAGGQAAGGRRRGRGLLGARAAVAVAAARLAPVAVLHSSAAAACRGRPHRDRRPRPPLRTVPRAPAPPPRRPRTDMVPRQEEVGE